MLPLGASDLPPVRLALVGLGKIARDQHVPALAGAPGFALTATVDPNGYGLSGVPTSPAWRRCCAGTPRGRGGAVHAATGSLSLAARVRGRPACCWRSRPAPPGRGGGARRRATHRTTLLPHDSRYAAGVAPARGGCATASSPVRHRLARGRRARGTDNWIWEPGGWASSTGHQRAILAAPSLPSGDVRARAGDAQQPGGPSRLPDFRGRQAPSPWTSTGRQGRGQWTSPSRPTRDGCSCRAGLRRYRCRGSRRPVR